MFNNTSPTQDEITDESGTRENTEVIYPNTTVEVGMYMSKTPWTQMVIVWRKERYLVLPILTLEPQFYKRQLYEEPLLI